MDTCDGGQIWTTPNLPLPERQLRLRSPSLWTGREDGTRPPFLLLSLAQRVQAHPAE